MNHLVVSDFKKDEYIQDRYQIESELGKGSFGVVYSA